MKWEYMDIGSFFPDMDEFNKLGQDGWELCGISPTNGDYGVPRFIFKRPVRVETGPHIPK